MPPFSSALLPLSLKEIGGLGPTEGDCVSRLPTIMTLRSVTRRQRDILHDVCQICLCISLFFFLSLSLYSSLINFCPVLLSQVSVTDEETDKMNLFLFVRLRREVQELKGVKKTESHRDKRVQLYFLFIQALFETVGRNRGCIHLLFYTSADPHSSSLPPALFSFNSLFSPPFVSF